MSDPGPIEEQHRATMNKLARALDELFKPKGFALLVFDLGSHDGRMNYISNARRSDMLTALKEFVAANEGRTAPPPGVKQ